MVTKQKRKLDAIADLDVVFINTLISKVMANKQNVNEEWREQMREQEKIEKPAFTLTVF